MTLPCSIIIPVFNRVALTRQCLAAIAADDGCRAEIVIVDDASREDTADLLVDARGARVVRNERNLGFATSCNRGADVSAGDYLLFLNNDTIPQKNWLKALVTYAERNPAAAVVGS